MTKRKTPAKAPPGSGVRFSRSDEGYKRLATETRASYRSVADWLEKGEPLNELDRSTLAKLLRMIADQIPDNPPRSPGHQHQFDPGGVAMTFAIMTIHKGLSEDAAVAALAEQNDVSVEAIKQALWKYKDEALRTTQGAHYAGKKSKS